MSRSPAYSPGSSNSWSATARRLTPQSCAWQSVGQSGATRPRCVYHRACALAALGRTPAQQSGQVQRVVPCNPAPARRGFFQLGQSVQFRQGPAVSASAANIVATANANAIPPLPCRGLNVLHSEHRRDLHLPKSRRSRPRSDLSTISAGDAWLYF